MLLNRHNLNVAKFCSKEVSRYTLDVIQVSKQGTVATDGYRLAIVTLPSEKDENFPQDVGGRTINPAQLVDDQSVNVESKAALAAAKAIPKKSTIPALSSTCGAKRGSTDGSIPCSQPRKGLVGFWPLAVTGPRIGWYRRGATNEPR